MSNILAILFDFSAVIMALLGVISGVVGCVLHILRRRADEIVLFIMMSFCFSTLALLFLFAAHELAR
jgi:hypothetical protein